MARLAAVPSLSYEHDGEVQSWSGRNCRCSSLPPAGEHAVELLESPSQILRNPPNAVVPVQQSGLEIATRNVRAESSGASWATLGLACFAFGLVLWNAFLVYALVLGLPRNDFCRMYYSTRAYWQREDIYGWNPSTPARLGADLLIDLWNMNPPHFHVVLLPIAILPMEAALGCWWVVNLFCLAISLRW